MAQRLPKTPRYSRISFGANGDTGRRNVCHISFARTDLRAPIAASATAVASSLTLTTSGTTAQTLTEVFLDVPRNVTVTLGGTTANIGAGSLVITGTDVNGAQITDTLTVTAATGGLLTGVKAFRSVQSLAYPATTGSGVTSTVGVGSKLGLATRNLSSMPVMIWNRNGAGGQENNAETLAAPSASTFDASVVANNTVTLSGTLNGSNEYAAYVLNYNWKLHPLVGDNNSQFGLK